MKKRFEFGTTLESNTDYFATEQEYHVYTKDTVTVCDDRYVALRAQDTKAFNVFMLIKGKKNITLDFGGATIVMHGKIQPFLIDLSENITIKNCNITYDRLPYTESLITEVTPEYARLRLNPHCPCRLENGQLIPYSDTWENTKLNYKGCFYQVFDTTTRKGAGIGLGVMGNSIELDPNWPYIPTEFTVEADGEDFLLKGNIPPYFQPNQALIISHETRSLSSVFIIDSKNTYLENYRILCGWGMGVYSYRAENITLEGVRLTHDEASPSIIANAADAVHAFGTSGRYEIRNSIFEGMIDDAINIHSNFRMVAKAEGRTIFSHLASCEKQAGDLYRVGDKIAVYRGKTMELVAEYVIEGIEDYEETIKKFILDRPAEPHSEGDLIENLTANCDITIENCVFGKANSHLRLQSRGTCVLRNCESELPIYLTGDASFWFESSPITDLTIETCRFIGEHGTIQILSEVLPTKAAPYYHRNIKIIDNEFESTIPLSGGYADGIVFKGNKNSNGASMVLTLTNCGSVDADNCTVERKTEVKETLNLN